MEARLELGVECRSELVGDTLSGHAAVFNHRARIGNFDEELHRSAFDKALTGDVPALVNHEPSKVLGRTTSGTLRLSTDDSGLYFEIPKLPNTTYANDLRESVSRGDINGMSFGFIPGLFTRGRAAMGRQLRSHTSIERLLDISPVTYPAYTGTDLLLRSFDPSAPEVSLREQLLRLDLNLIRR